jgi:hypothetical protein
VQHGGGDVVVLGRDVHEAARWRRRRVMGVHDGRAAVAGGHRLVFWLGGSGSSEFRVVKLVSWDRGRGLWPRPGFMVAAARDIIRGVPASNCRSGPELGLQTRLQLNL